MTTEKYWEPLVYTVWADSNEKVLDNYVVRLP